MKQKILSVTVGMPAFNEESNIGSLLQDILKQKGNIFEIKRIIVASDASTDKTGEVIKKLNDSRIEFIDNKTREGVAARQNQVLRRADTDIVVLMDADIRLPDPLYLQKLLEPCAKRDIDLVSGDLVATAPQTFIEKILGVSLLCKTEMYEKLRNGDNVYTCHGTTRAFSRRLYTILDFKQSVAEDAYSYLFAKKNNFTYEYVKDAITVHKLPETLADHIKQSLRFFHSSHFLNNEFGEKVVKKEYHIPFMLLFGKSMKYFLRYPIEFCTYVFIALLLMIRARFSELESNTWSIVETSKLTQKI